MQKSNNIRSDFSQKFQDRLLQRMRETLRVVEGDYWFIVRPDVFAIPYLDGYLLYSPLQGLELLITRTGLASLLLNESSPISECLAECLVEGDSEIIKLFDTQTKQQPAIHTKNSLEFRPTHLTLSPTVACQLACIYCYIHGGDNPRNMPWEMAEAAIRYTVENAACNGLKEFELYFHGQGEPTANWWLFHEAVLFAEMQCIARGLQPRFYVMTNGILNDEKISFIADHKIKVGISLDGLKESMDIQRPLRSGGSTFEKVMQTIHSFEEKGVDFGIRSTVTTANMEEMKDFVDFIKNKTQCRHISFEPVCGVGRALDNKLDGSNIMSQFVHNFQEARAVGILENVDVSFSTCRIDGLRSNFCNAYGTKLNFVVSTDGLVSSCYEVLEESDPRSEIFIYGKYDATSRSFKLNEKRLERLLNINVTKMDRCRDCYVKWNCGGDCLSKAALGGIERLKDDVPLERCVVSRILTKDELVRSLFLKPLEK